MMQDRLGALVGKPSGYLKSLPPAVKRRVEGLKGIQTEHAKIEGEFQREILEIEKKVQFAITGQRVSNRAANVHSRTVRCPLRSSLHSTKGNHRRKDRAHRGRGHCRRSRQ